MSVTEVCGKPVRIGTRSPPCDRVIDHNGECSSIAPEYTLRQCIETMDIIIAEQRELNRKMSELIEFLKSRNSL